MLCLLCGVHRLNLENHQVVHPRAKSIRAGGDRRSRLVPPVREPWMSWPADDRAQLPNSPRLPLITAAQNKCVGLLPHPAPDDFGAATKSGSKPLTVSPSLNDLRTRHCGSPPMDPCLASLARILPPSIACHFAHRDVRSMPIKFSHFSPTLPPNTLFFYILLPMSSYGCRAQFVSE